MDDSDEAYGIDRARGHPRALELIPDEFFWDCTNELAPFGSDEGDMALDEYRRWRRDNKLAPLVECIRWVIESVGEMNPDEYTGALADEALVSRQVEDPAFDDHQYIFTVDASVIATGFGELADAGAIEDSAKRYVQTAINRELVWAPKSLDRESVSEYVSNLRRLNEVLHKA